MSKYSPAEERLLKEYRPFAEQSLLRHSSEIESSLEEWFEAVSAYVLDAYAAAKDQFPELYLNERPTIFLSYAWTDLDAFPEDWWTQHFNLWFAVHLDKAGFDVKLDITKSRYGKDPVPYMEEGIAQSDFILLMLTRSLGKKYRAETPHNIQTEVALISSQLDAFRERDLMHRVLPILMTGDMGDVLPDVLQHLDSTGVSRARSDVESFSDDSYFTFFRKLIQQFVNTLLHPYQDLAQEAHEHALVEPAGALSQTQPQNFSDTPLFGFVPVMPEALIDTTRGELQERIEAAALSRSAYYDQQAVLYCEALGLEGPAAQTAAVNTVVDEFMEGHPDGEREAVAFAANAMRDGVGPAGFPGIFAAAQTMGIAPGQQQLLSIVLATCKHADPELIARFTESDDGWYGKPTYLTDAGMPLYCKYFARMGVLPGQSPTILHRLEVYADANYEVLFFASGEHPTPKDCRDQYRDAEGVTLRQEAIQNPHAPQDGLAAIVGALTG